MKIGPHRSKMRADWRYGKDPLPLYQPVQNGGDG